MGKIKPTRVVEIGPGKGSTTITMAQALKELKIDGHINSYDIWDDGYWGNY